MYNGKASAFLVEELTYKYESMGTYLHNERY